MSGWTLFVGDGRDLCPSWSAAGWTLRCIEKKLKQGYTLVCPCAVTYIVGNYYYPSARLTTGDKYSGEEMCSLEQNKHKTLPRICTLISWSHAFNNIVWLSYTSCFAMMTSMQYSNAEDISFVSAHAVNGVISSCQWDWPNTARKQHIYWYNLELCSFGYMVFCCEHHPPGVVWVANSSPIYTLRPSLVCLSIHTHAISMILIAQC